MDINTMLPGSGMVVEEDGSVTDAVGMLAEAFGVQPIANIKVDPNVFLPRTGRVFDESGNVYSIMDILRAIIAGGGGGSGGVTRHDLLARLGFDESGHRGFASQPELNAVREIAEDAQNRVALLEAIVTEFKDLTNGQFSLIWAQINAIQALGKKVGIYATESDLPPDTSHADAAGVTENDWALVSDEAAIYLIDSIDDSGVITWKFGFAFETAPAQMLFSTVPFDENSLLPGQVGGVYDDA